MRLLLFLSILWMFLSCDKEENSNNELQNSKWRFAVLGDTHVTTNSDTVMEMIPFIIEDSVDLVVVCGDIVEGGLRTTSTFMKSELEMFQSIFQTLYDNKIGVYTMRGNHENDVTNNLSAWNSIFSGLRAFPQNGAEGETNLTYSFTHNNALFIVVDNYVSIHRVNQSWLDEQLASNIKPHVFVFGHEAAFKVFHTDCLDDYPTERNQFWQSLTNAGVRSYFCGHDHFFDAIQINNGDSNIENDIYQFVVGGGGGWLMSKYNHNGSNSPYSISPKYHRKEHGYALVEICGKNSSDLEVTIRWKERVVDDMSDNVSYVNTDYVITFEVPQK